jgi:hypothetical protein
MICGDSERVVATAGFDCQLVAASTTTKGPDLAANVAGRVRDTSRMEGQ